MKIERVLMTGDTVGGVWTFTLELAGGLAERGIEVLLVALGGKASQVQRDEAGAIPGLCLLDSPYRLEWMEEPWADIEASGRWLLRIEQEYRPDVVHLNSFGHGALGWQTPVVLTAHSCVLSWWQAVKGKPAPASWNSYRELVSKSLAAVPVLTAPSMAMAKAIQVYYGASDNCRILPTAPSMAMAKAIQVYYGASDNCRILPNGRTAAKFSMRQKEPFIFTAGRLWDEAKNLRAVSSIASRLPWPVCCAGDIGACDGGCNVLGRLSEAEISAWYGRASIYTMPARYEPFGLSILEAALSRCPLVLGDIPSLREIWGCDAVFVPPDDAGSLESALRNLIDNPELRHEFGQRAYARALSFNPNRMSRAYLGAYQDAVSTSTLSSGRLHCIS